MLTRIETCRFQRVQNGAWEMGLLLNEGELGILDKLGKEVEQCYDYHRTSSLVLDNLDNYLEDKNVLMYNKEVVQTLAIDIDTSGKRMMPVPRSELFD